MSENNTNGGLPVLTPTSLPTTITPYPEHPLKPLKRVIDVHSTTSTPVLTYEQYKAEQDDKYKRIKGEAVAYEQKINTPGNLVYNPDDYADALDIEESNIDPDFGKSSLDTKKDFIYDSDFGDLSRLRAENQSSFGNFMGHVGKTATQFASTVVQTIPSAVNTLLVLSNVIDSATTGFKTDGFNRSLRNSDGSFNWQEMVAPWWDKSTMFSPMADLISNAEDIENWGQKNFKTYKGDYNRQINKGHVIAQMTSSPLDFAGGVLENVGFMAGSIVGTKGVGLIGKGVVKGIAKAAVKIAGKEAGKIGLLEADEIIGNNINTAEKIGKGTLKQIPTNVSGQGASIGVEGVDEALSTSVKQGSKALHMIGSTYLAGATEASMEARNNTEDWYNLQIAQITDRHNAKLAEINKEYANNKDILWQKLNEENANFAATKERINTDRIKMGSEIFAVNLPIIMGADMLAYGKFFCKGFKASRAMGESEGGIISKLLLKDESKVLIRKVADKSAIGFHYESGKLRSLARAALTKTEGATAEGGQEVMQQFLADVTGFHYEKDVDQFYNSSYAPEAVKGYASWIGDLGKGISKSWNESDIGTQFVSAFLSTMIGLPTFAVGGRNLVDHHGKERKVMMWNGSLRTEFLDNRRKAKETAGIVSNLNAAMEDPKTMQMLTHAVSGLYFDNEGNKASLKGDIREMKDFDFKSLFRTVSLFHDAGKMSDLQDLMTIAADKAITKNDAAQLVNMATYSISNENVREKFKQDVQDIDKQNAELDNYIAQKKDISTDEKSLIKEQKDANDLRKQDLQKQLDSTTDLTQTYNAFGELGSEVDISKVTSTLAKRKKVVNALINDYIKVRENIDYHTNGQLATEDLNLMTFLKLTTNDANIRAQKMVNNTILPVLRELVTSAPETFTVLNKEAKNLYKGTIAVEQNKPLSIEEKEIETKYDAEEKGLNALQVADTAAILANPKNNKFVATLWKAIVNHPSDFYINGKLITKEEAVQALQDTIALNKKATSYNEIYKAYQQKPSLVSKHIAKTKKEAQKTLLQNLMKEHIEQLQKSDSFDDFIDNFNTILQGDNIQFFNIKSVIDALKEADETKTAMTEDGKSVFDYLMKYEYAIKLCENIEYGIDVLFNKYFPDEEGTVTEKFVVQNNEVDFAKEVGTAKCTRDLIKNAKYLLQEIVNKYVANRENAEITTQDYEKINTLWQETIRELPVSTQKLIDIYFNNVKKSAEEKATTENSMDIKSEAFTQMMENTKVFLNSLAKAVHKEVTGVLVDYFRVSNDTNTIPSSENTNSTQPTNTTNQEKQKENKTVEEVQEKEPEAPKKAEEEKKEVQKQEGTQIKEEAENPTKEEEISTEKPLSDRAQNLYDRIVDSSTENFNFVWTTLLYTGNVGEFLQIRDKLKEKDAKLYTAVIEVIEYNIDQYINTFVNKDKTMTNTEEPILESPTTTLATNPIIYGLPVLKDTKIDTEKEKHPILNSIAQVVSPKIAEKHKNRERNIRVAKIQSTLKAFHVYDFLDYGYLGIINQMAIKEGKTLKLCTGVFEGEKYLYLPVKNVYYQKLLQTYPGLKNFGNIIVDHTTGEEYIMMGATSTLSTTNNNNTVEEKTHQINPKDEFQIDSIDKGVFTTTERNHVLNIPVDSEIPIIAVISDHTILSYNGEQEHLEIANINNAPNGVIYMFIRGGDGKWYPRRITTQSPDLDNVSCQKFILKNFYDKHAKQDTIDGNLFSLIHSVYYINSDDVKISCKVKEGPNGKVVIITFINLKTSKITKQSLPIVNDNVDDIMIQGLKAVSEYYKNNDLQLHTQLHLSQKNNNDTKANNEYISNLFNFSFFVSNLWSVNNEKVSYRLTRPTESNNANQAEKVVEGNSTPSEEKGSKENEKKATETKQNGVPADTKEIEAKLAVGKESPNLQIATTVEASNTAIEANKPTEEVSSETVSNVNEEQSNIIKAGSVFEMASQITTYLMYITEKYPDLDEAVDLKFEYGKLLDSIVNQASHYEEGAVEELKNAKPTTYAEYIQARLDLLSKGTFSDEITEVFTKAAKKFAELAEEFNKKFPNEEIENAPLKSNLEEAKATEIKPEEVAEEKEEKENEGEGKEIKKKKEEKKEEKEEEKEEDTDIKEWEQAEAEEQTVLKDSGTGVPEVEKENTKAGALIAKVEFGIQDGGLNSIVLTYKGVSIENNNADFVGLFEDHIWKDASIETQNMFLQFIFNSTNPENTIQTIENLVSKTYDLTSCNRIVLNTIVTELTKSAC